MDISFFDSGFFSWVVIPVLIFIARIVDVTLGTIRIIYISRGMKYLAPFFGFFEILIWLLAITQIMKNVTNIAYYLAYATGFAMGNFIGIWVEERLAVGRVVIRIITQRDAAKLIAHLRAAEYGVTAVDAEGARGPVKIIFTIINRNDVEAVIRSVRQYNPKAFYTIEDVRLAKEGIFRRRKSL